MKRYKAKHEKLAKEKENIVRAIKDGDPGSMRKEAIEHVRTLIEKIILTPKANQKNQGEGLRIFRSWEKPNLNKHQLP